DPLRMDNDQRLRLMQDDGAAAYLDAARPKWRQYVVDDDSGPPVTGDVPELLGGGQIDTADLHDARVVVKRPSDWRNVRSAVHADGGQSGQVSLSLQEGEFCLGKHGHGASSVSGMASGTPIVKSAQHEMPDPVRRRH